MRILGQRSLVVPGVVLLVAGTVLGAVLVHRGLDIFNPASFGALLLCAAAVSGGALFLAPVAADTWTGSLSLIGRAVGAATLALCGAFVLLGREEGILLLALGGLVAYGAGEALRIAALLVRSRRRA